MLGKLDKDLVLIELKMEETFGRVAVYLGKKAFKDFIEQNGPKHQGFLIVDSTQAARKLIKENM